MPQRTKCMSPCDSAHRHTPLSAADVFRYARGFCSSHGHHSSWLVKETTAKSSLEQRLIPSGSRGIPLCYLKITPRIHRLCFAALRMPLLAHRNASMVRVLLSGEWKAQRQFSFGNENSAIRV